MALGLVGFPFIGQEAEAWRWGAGVLMAPLLLVFFLRAWPTSALLILLVAPLLTRFRWEWGSVSVRAEHVAATVLCVMVAFHLLVRCGRLRLPLAAWFALTWWGMNLFSALLSSPDRMASLQNSLRLFLIIATFLLTINLIADRQQWRWAVTAFVLLGIAEAAFGLLALSLYPLGRNLGVQVGWAFPAPIPYGTFEEGNLFGSHSAAWALVVLTLLLVDRQRTQRGWRLAGLIVLVAAVGLSLSRAAWLMLIAGVALIWLVQQPSARRRWYGLTALLALTPLTLLLIWGLLSVLPSGSAALVMRLKTFETLGSDPTFSVRIEDWSLAWSDWLQRPLIGWGPGSFFALHGIRNYKPAWIGNLSLRLLHETGLIGALLFAGFFGTLIGPALRTAWRQTNLSDRAALLGLALSYVMLLGVAYQSTDGIWLAASWVHAGLIAAGARVLLISPDRGEPTPTLLLTQT